MKYCELPELTGDSGPDNTGDDTPANSTCCGECSLSNGSSTFGNGLAKGNTGGDGSATGSTGGDGSTNGSADGNKSTNGSTGCDGSANGSTSGGVSSSRICNGGSSSSKRDIGLHKSRWGSNNDDDELETVTPAPRGGPIARG